MRNPTTRNKTRAKCLGELLKGTYGICPQAIKPSYRHLSQIGWKHFTHQGFVLGMDRHSLVEVAHMLYRICSAVVNGECWLVESPREYCPLNVACERQSGNLVQDPAHSIISQASVWWALVSTFMMVFYFVGKRFARWSF